MPFVPFDGLLGPAIVAFPGSVLFVAAPLHFLVTSLKLCSASIGSSVALLAIGCDFAFFQIFESLESRSEQASFEFPFSVWYIDVRLLVLLICFVIFVILEGCRGHNFQCFEGIVFLMLLLGPRFHSLHQC